MPADVRMYLDPARKQPVASTDPLSSIARARPTNPDREVDWVAMADPDDDEFCTLTRRLSSTLVPFF